jgi:hypothetical protein
MAGAASSWFLDIEPHNSGRKQSPDHQDVSTDAEEKAEPLLPKVSDITDKWQRRSLLNVGADRFTIFEYEHLFSMVV